MSRKLGRNAPCWCGSGKKYKRCHAKSDQAERAISEHADARPSGRDLDSDDDYGFADWTEEELGSLPDMYDANVAPEPEVWLAAEEDERKLWVEAFHYFKEPHPVPEEPRLHDLMHTMVENQAALGNELHVRAAMVRLQNEGLTRHESVHAVGQILSMHLFDAMQGGQEFDEETYAAELDALTAEAWANQTLGDQR